MTAPRSQYLRALGARLRSEANDLKRTSQAVADELGFPRSDVEAVFSGCAGSEQAMSLAAAFRSTYPVSFRDTDVDLDDTEGGIRIMSAEESIGTSRTFDRPSSEGELVPYYEYRDTATARSAPFRPEWIRPIRVIADPDPQSPEVAMNKGHLLHQFTYIVGDVTLYWEQDDRRCSQALASGDSCYITPFVPHSFASRDPSAPGLIVAVTFAGSLKRALGEVGPDQESLDMLAGRLDDPRQAFASRLRRCMAAESLDTNGLIERLSLKGMSLTRGRDIACGFDTPSASERDIVADSVSAPYASLFSSSHETSGGVCVRRRTDAPTRILGEPRGDPSYEVVDLVRTDRQPHLKAFLIRPLCQHPIAFQHGLHSYIYNLGLASASIEWVAADGRTLQSALHSGGSAYVRPLIAHRLGIESGSTSQLLVVRVPGSLDNNALDEFATFGPSRRRAFFETDQWF